MLYSTSSKFSFIFPIGRKYFVLVSLAVGNHGTVCPVINCERMVIIFSNRQKFIASRAEGELAHCPPMEPEKPHN